MAKISARNAQPVTKVKATLVASDRSDAWPCLFVVASDGRILRRFTSPSAGYKVFDQVDPAAWGAKPQGLKGRARFTTTDAPRLQELLIKGLTKLGYTNVRPA